MSAVYLTFVYHYACSILITEFSHLNDLHFGLFQTLWADAQPCKIWSADALVGLRLLCVCTEWYTSYIHFYLVKRRPHLHPDRENCMLKILKCQLQGNFVPLTPWPGALPLDPTGDTASDPHYRLALPRSPWASPQTFRQNSACARNAILCMILLITLHVNRKRIKLRGLDWRSGDGAREKHKTTE